MKTRSHTKTGPGRIPFGRTPKAGQMKILPYKAHTKAQKLLAVEAWSAVGRLLGLDRLHWQGYPAGWRHM